MAGLSGFPDQIEVVIGSGWNEPMCYFVEDDVVIVQKYSDSGGVITYSEDGTSVAHPSTNRLQVKFAYGPPAAYYRIRWTAFLTTMAFFTSYGFVHVRDVAGAAGATYTFKDIWTNTAIQAGGYYHALFPFTDMPYNPDVFKGMQEYPPPAGPSADTIDVAGLTAKGIIIS
jgi:hypothetical protein